MKKLKKKKKAYAKRFSLYPLKWYDALALVLNVDKRKIKKQA
jgi:hypothetical protein